MTWTLLQRKYPELEGYACPRELKITIYPKCIYVHLARKGNLRGVSICISFNDYLSLLIERNLSKAKSKDVTERANNIYTVPSSQVATELQTVYVTTRDIKCSCFLYKCLKNRIAKESPYLDSLLQKSPYFKGKVVCHHAEAVLNFIGFNSLRELQEHVFLTEAKEEFRGDLFDGNF